MNTDKVIQFIKDRKNLIAIIGSALLLAFLIYVVNAASPFTAFEAEGANLSGNATVKSASGTSGGSYVEFGESASPPPVAGNPPLAPYPIPQTSKNSGPIEIRDQSNVVIDGYNFTGSGTSNCIYIWQSTNVTIKNSRFTNCYKAILASRSTNITVIDSYFYADKAGTGRNSVQIVESNHAYIARNTSIRTNGNTISEDHINLYNSSGTANNPIIVEENYLKGSGPSTSGTGIVLGDVHGDYQTVRNNTVLYAGQVGIGIAGGVGNKILNNLIYSPKLPWSNVGVTSWEYTGNSPPCYGHEISNNQVDWINKNGSRNSYYIPTSGNTSCGTVTGLNTNNWNASLQYLDK